MLPAACGLGAGDAPAATPSARPVTIVWQSDWTAAERGEVAGEGVAAFRQRYPHVTVDPQGWQYGGGTFQALSAHLAAGTLGDVVLGLPNFFPQWAERAVFADAAAELRKLRFDKDAVFWAPEVFEHKGKTLGVPFQFVAHTWVYNKTLFEKSGVAPPTDAWTTADFLEAGKRLAVPAENRYGMRSHSSVYTSWPFVYANGTDVVSDGPPFKAQFDTPKAIEVFGYLVDLIHRHRVAPILEGKSPVQGVDFQLGNVAMSQAGQPKVTHKRVQGQFEMAIMPWPRWQGTRRRVTEWTHQGLYLTAQGKDRGHAEAAAQFMAHMGGEAVQTLIARIGGGVPTVKKVAFGAVYLDGAIPNLKLAFDTLEKKADQEVRSYKLFLHTQEVQAPAGPVLAEAFGGAISVPDMAAQAQRAAQAAIDAAGR